MNNTLNCKAFLSDFFSRVSIVLLTPHGRSGSIFMQRLFDGHSEVYTLPGFLNHANFIKSSNNFDEALSLFVANNKSLFNVAAGCFSEAYTTKTFNDKIIQNFGIDNFKRNMLELHQHFHIENDLYFTIAIHIVFATFYKVNLDKISKILIHIHNYEQDFYLPHKTIQNLQSPHAYFFENTQIPVKMICLMRHPLESYFSFSIIAQDKGIDYFFKINAQTFKTFYYMAKNIEAYSKEKFFILDLGNLHQNPKETLTTLCEFLDVKYEPVIEYATVCGCEWVGISANCAPSSSFDSQKSKLRYLEVKKESVYKKYFLILSWLFENVNTHFGYKDDLLSFKAKSRVFFLLLMLLFQFNKNIGSRIDEKTDYNASRFFALIKALFINDTLAKKITRFYFYIDSYLSIPCEILLRVKKILFLWRTKRKMMLLLGKIKKI